MVFGYTKYVSREAEDGIKKFVYKGGSDSIFYKYIWSPLTEFLVERVVPHWVAPNVITLVGYLFLIFAHIVIIYHSPNFNTPLPTWVLCLGGFALLSYQILDNLDGKQARKTKNSSPLGMLFDHGCDSSTAWIVGLSQLCVQGVGINSIMFYAILIANFIGFYMGMWNQYHCGVFRLGYINAIDEGLVMAWGLYFFTAIVGYDFWQQKVFGDYRLTELAAIGFVFLACCQIYDFTQSTVRGTRGRKPLWKVLHNQGVTVLLVATMVIVDWYSPSKITKSNYCYFLLVSLGATWSKITLHLQIAHLGNEEKEYEQFRKSFVIICASYIVNVLSYYVIGSVIVNEVYLTLGLFVFSLYSYIHTCVCVAKQLSEILDIHILHYNPPKKL